MHIDEEFLNLYKLLSTSPVSLSRLPDADDAKRVTSWISTAAHDGFISNYARDISPFLKPRVVVGDLLHGRGPHGYHFPMTRRAMPRDIVFSGDKAKTAQPGLRRTV